MKGKKGQSPELILGIAGAIFAIIGAIILMIGITANKPNTVGTGAVAILVGVFLLILAKKFG